MPTDGPVRVLLVEDNPGDARLFRARLEDAEGEYEVRHARKLEESRSLVGEFEPDLCFLDLGLPDSAGSGTVERFRDAAPEVPVIVVTGLDDLDSAADAVRAGAVDYLVKDEITARSLSRTIRSVLERERIWRTLQASEEKWSTVFAASPVAVVISDADTGRLIEVNRAFEEMFGLDREQLLGETSLGLGQWEDPGRREELVEQVRAEGGFDREEAWYRDADGDRGRMLLSCRQLELSGEDRLLWTVQDITERVERERALEARTADLRERVKEQSCLYDVSQHLHDPERPLSDCLQSVVDRIPAGWQYPEVTEARLRMDDGVFTTGGFVETEAPLTASLHVDGEEVGVIEVVYVEERPPADVGPFITEEQRLLDEIAAQVEREISHRRTRRELGRVVETMNEALAIVDADGEVAFANSAARNFLPGEEGAVYVGQDLDVLDARLRTLDGEPYPREELPFERVMRTGEPVTGVELLYETRDGGRTAVSVNAAPIERDDGSIESVVITFRDVTEERESREALRASEARLRTLVETMAEGVVIVDREGQLVFANPRAGEIFGVEPEALTRRSFDDAEWRINAVEGGPFPEEELPFHRVREADAAVYDVEHGIERGDGTRSVVSVNAAPLRTSEGAFDGIVATIRDVTERKRMEDQLRYLAYHDPLTDLANRTLFLQQLEKAVASADRRPPGVALLMADLDRFKVVNDSLGHTAGDRVLVEVARRLEGAVRDEDTVARWGGDEFCVLLPSLTEESGLEAARTRLMSALQAPLSVLGSDLEVDVTFGAVLYGVGETSRAVRVETAEDLMRYASRALQRAKQRAGTSFYRYVPERDESEEETNWLRREQDLRRAVDAGQFEVFYQPILHLDTGAVWGVEPLVRWRHPEHGLVGPQAFIPIAEETGLIHELGRLVLERAVGDVTAWDEAVGRPRLTPNVSGEQFEDDDLVPFLASCLEEAGLAQDRVILEVTETAIMRATHRIGELKDLGVDVMIDDFGTGYSSMLYLRDLEVDGLKVDMSFVHGLGAGRGNTAIVRSMLTLGREMGLDVVAEGIEEPHQLERLRAMGCELGQGFHFARPMDAEETYGFLASAPEAHNA